MPKDKVCFTCSKANNQDITIHRIDGTADPYIEDTKLSETKSIIPFWFKKAGNYSPLPASITCDDSLNPFHSDLPEQFPYPHDESITFNINDINNFPQIKHRQQTIYFWAAHPKDLYHPKIKSAPKAYGDFSNSGIARVDKHGNVTIHLASPQPYTVDGILYPPHVHFTTLMPNNVWCTEPWAVDIYPHLDLHEFHDLWKQRPREYLIINTMDQTYKGKDTPHIPKTFRIPYNTPQSGLVSQIKAAVDRKRHGRNRRLVKYLRRDIRYLPIILYCGNPKCSASHTLGHKLLKIGFANIHYFSGGTEAWFKK